ncbi:hypothetical protein VNI00_003837 [Paramarasmius palmivorus]|uniref:F-box domain-containing protein n=1 Tax=Paramarasmius palmivorus TaxID=297713 RepID=A0AAW0DNP2_9AGAR
MAHLILCKKCDEYIGFSTPPALSAHIRVPDYVPSSQERIENLAAIREEEELLEEYDKKISQLREILGTLEEHRVALNQQISQRRSLISALRNIPPEILDEIFACVCEDTRYSLAIPVSSPPPILSISQVSSRWRRTALSRPKLWSSITVDANLAHPRSCDMISTFLRNAGSYPLTLAVHGIEFRPIPSFGEDVVRMLLFELERCEELEINLDWEVLDRILSNHHLSRLSFPHLRVFKDKNYRVIDEASSTTYRVFRDALKRAPNLVELDTPNYYGLDALPFHQLTSLRTDELDSTEALRMIGFCPNLKRLDIFSADPRGLSTFAPVNLPSLKRLSIYTSIYPFSTVSELFSQFAMARLEVLELESSAEEITEHDQSPPLLFSMFQRTSSSLQVLVLDTGDAPLPRTYYTDILQLLPNLKCFTACNALPWTADGLGNGANSEYILHLIQSLTITATSSPQSILVPGLVTLRLMEHNTRMTSDYAAVLLDMAESRVDEVTDSETSMMVVELKYTPWKDAEGNNGALELDHIVNWANDSEITDRVELLAEDGIQCTIRECRGWLCE